MTDFNPLQKQNDIDWVQHWNDLVIARNWKYEPKTETDFDYWQKNARDYSRRVMSRWKQPDSTRDFLIAVMQKQPGATLLDIGAGTGNWAIQLAAYLSKVTAIEPSAGMRMVFDEVLRGQKPPIGNITLVNGKWPEVETMPHDFTLCSHAMYGFAETDPKIDVVRSILAKNLMQNESGSWILAKHVRVALADHPNDAMERVPFIEGYAQMSRWEDAATQSKAMLTISPLYNDVLCALWQRIDRETPDSASKSAADQEIGSLLNCEFLTTNDTK